jgi:hypothetical protein
MAAAMAAVKPHNDVNLIGKIGDKGRFCDRFATADTSM